MANDLRPPRLHVDAPLALGEAVALPPEQANYLLSVLRLSAGDRALAFNGRDGEYLAEIAPAGRKSVALRPTVRTRPPEPAPDVDLMFAPLKHARLDYMAQKAVEMGAGRLCPVLTRRTQVGRLNLDRLRANALEAAEQCGAVWTPEVRPMTSLDQALAAQPEGRVIVFCDEAAEGGGPLEALAVTPADRGVSVLIGPEGGFDEAERAAILRLSRVLRLSLGPRVLRADTAAVAALALVQASLGDWRASAV